MRWGSGAGCRPRLTSGSGDARTPYGLRAARGHRQQPGSAPSSTVLGRATPRWWRGPTGPRPLPQRVLTSVFILGRLASHRAGSGGHREG